MDLKELLGEAYREDMTLEEVAEALKNVETPTKEVVVDNSGEVKRLKEALTKSNKEAGDYRKQLKAFKTDEEIKEQERLEELENLRKERDELLKDKLISDHTAKYLGLGYDEKLAEETAKAFVEGDTAKVFENQQKHQVAFEKKIKAETLNSTPKPIRDSETGADGEMTLEKLRAMSVGERMKFAQENPDKYKELYGG